ncbi:hypothetical protein IV203_015865 [Nitzschia inconspicua]|uniref:Uncharacterized protein n=1 Tax=Nitzschia inconspicua TaxID=303405 RepID=A0A9K3PTZ1_9STRA|nr:hypothetical protein IV203_015865 [Nitzschia inconspicua]
MRTTTTSTTTRIRSSRSAAALLLLGCLLSTSVQSVHAFSPKVFPTRSKVSYSSSSFPSTTRRFATSTSKQRQQQQQQESTTRSSLPMVESPEESIYERIAKVFFDESATDRVIAADDSDDLRRTNAYTSTVSLLRVGLPSLFLAASAKISYTPVAIQLANTINDSGVFAVVAQDASQYIQNILTTSGLMFSILVGQTYYFMYQQQEAIYLALFEEVTIAKSLLEQVALVSQGRQLLYEQILTCIQDYVRHDLTKFNDIEPAEMIASRPCDDPLEEVLYLTSVGEPSLVYQTVRSLRQARAARLGALQRKLPQLQMILLWTLAAIVLFTFPLLGAGVQTIGGYGILQVQSWYLGIIVLAISLTMGVINELRRPGQVGAYNARTVLTVMVAGLEEELDLRLSGKITGPPDLSMEPSIDSDGFFQPEILLEVDQVV